MSKKTLALLAMSVVAVAACNKTPSDTSDTAAVSSDDTVAAVSSDDTTVTADWQEAATWTDADGTSLKVEDGVLMSNKAGTTWTEVPGNTWKAENGSWYKFDAQGAVWMSSDAGQTWAPTEGNEWTAGGKTYTLESGKLMVSADTAAAVSEPVVQGNTSDETSSQ